MIHTLILLAEGEAQRDPGFTMLPAFILIAFVFWWLLIRPMRKQEQERQKLASNLKKNDEIVTNSGIYGTITDISDNEDKITVKIADNVRIKMTKGSVLRNLTNEEAAAAGKGSQKSQGIKLPEQGIKLPD